MVFHCVSLLNFLLLNKVSFHVILGNFSDSRYRPWPRVKQFLMDLEPGSFVCDVGNCVDLFESSGFNMLLKVVAVGSI